MKSAPRPAVKLFMLHMILLRLPLALLAAVTCLAAQADAPPPEQVLAEYVVRDHPAFTWQVRARHQRRGTEVVELRLTSQTWQGTAWRHRLYVIRPPNADLGSHHGVVMVAGGRWRPDDDAEPDGRLPDGAGVYLQIAERLGSIVAVIANVPFQPLFGLTEDELIAHTFIEYLQTGEPDWPLLLPMVNSVVRAMDAVQAYTADAWDVALEQFMVFGGSKRGWTSWLTAAVDPRVSAIAPLVIDVLNFAEHLPYQRDVWGRLSDDIAPYTRRGLDRILSQDEGQSLRTIVDPYSYRTTLTLPKLVVTGTNDSYFPLGSTNLYWPELEHPRYLLNIPNNGHSLRDFGRLLPTLAQLRRHVADGAPMPELRWEFRDSPAGPVLCMHSDIEPRRVRVWVAEADGTDFRDARFTPRRARQRGDVHVFTLQRQGATHAAMFGEFAYGPADRYFLSTTIRIVGPDVPGRAPHSDADVCPQRL